MHMNPENYEDAKEENQEFEESKEVVEDKNDAPFELLIQPQMDFEVNAIETTEKGERLPPTPEKIQEMDQRIKELSQLFGNLENVRWNLDGAMNISLMRGDYIGYHKDTDVSIEKDDLPQLEEQLYKNGYGLFLSVREEGADDEQKRIMRRVDYKAFGNADKQTEHRLIAAIDKNGKILDSNEFDLHLIERNENGEPITDVGAVMPEEWVLPQPIEYKGEKINLSHPSRVTYYKLHMQNNVPANGKYIRNYDKTDVERLLETGKISLQDVDELEKVYIDNENQANTKRARDIFERIAKNIEPDMNGGEIFKVFMKDPDIAIKETQMDKVSFDELSKSISVFTEVIAESEDKSGEAITNRAVEFFGREDEVERKQKQIEEIRKKVYEVQDSKEIEQIREKLEI